MTTFFSDLVDVQTQPLQLEMALSVCSTLGYRVDVTDFISGTYFHLLPLCMPAEYFS